MYLLLVCIKGTRLLWSSSGLLVVVVFGAQVILIEDFGERKMVPTTRSRAQKVKDALEHVLKVLDNKKYEAIFEEAGITNMDDFLIVDLVDIISLTPIDEEGNLVKLNAVEVGRLKKLVLWYELQDDSDPDIWLTLDVDSLTQTLCKTQLASNTPDVISSQPISQSSANKHVGILPGVKRSINEYP